MEKSKLSNNPNKIIFSCIIPASAKDLKSDKLKDLIDSIKAQDFQKDLVEIIIVTNFKEPLTETLHHNLEGIKLYFTDGDSEQAKSEGIRVSKGKICTMFCTDNFIVSRFLFKIVYTLFSKHDVTGIYTKYYTCSKNDNSLNRYFSLIGNNDPIAFYLGKNDRLPHYQGDEEVVMDLVEFKNKVPSLGDNGFFYLRKKIIETNLDHYYPMDNAEDLRKKGNYTYFRIFPAVWHRTSDSLISFLKKRYKYARDLYSDRSDRLWRMVDTKEDKFRLALFIFYTLTVIQPLYISFKGYSKVRDMAWFWHFPVCVGFLIIYTFLVLRNLFKYGTLFQCRKQVLLSRPLAEAKV